jgi:hypothetical protein
VVERMIQTAGIELCTESFGNPDDATIIPPILDHTQPL